jgi:hypothetical protein
VVRNKYKSIFEEIKFKKSQGASLEELFEILTTKKLSPEQAVFFLSQI